MTDKKKATPPPAPPAPPAEPTEGATVELEDDGDLRQHADPDGATVPEPWDDPDDDDQEEGADRA